MSGPLYRAVLRKGAQGTASYAIGMVVYLWLFIGIYPSFAHSLALNTLLRQLPHGLLQVLGYTAGVGRLAGFLGGEFYSLIYLLIMAIFALFGATRLVAHMVDNRSLALLLATPVSRARVAATQAAVLVTQVLCIGTVTAAAGLVGAHLFVHDSGLGVVGFLEMNLVGTLMFCVVAAYSFAFSCLAPDERSALSASALLTLVLFGLHVVSDLSPGLAVLNRFSLFSVFDSQALIRGKGPILADVVGLCLATAALVVLAIAGFRRRQLAL